MKISVVFFAMVMAAVPVFGQAGASAAVANRRTAVRYLQAAKNSAAQKAWADADAQAQVGLAYDESVADLWYLRAVSQFSAGAAKAAALTAEL